MKTIIANPPWITESRIGFRSNVRWPFTIPRSEFLRQKKCAYHFPIYQAYTAALFLQNQMDVGVIDSSVDELNFTSFLEKVAAEKPDILVIETSTPSFEIDLKTVEMVKKNLNVSIVLIGTHSSIYHKELMEKYPFIDIIARGEYELPVLEIARNIEKGKGLSDVPGVTHRKGSKVIVNENRPYIENLDSLPFPARDLYHWDRYHEPIYEKLPWITMITSRGCPYQCIFCSWPQVMYGHKFRTRSIDNVLDEIEHCLLRYKPGEIFFDDDTFTISQSRVRALCQEIIKRNLSFIWSCMGRIDTVDEHTLSLMKEAGCRKIKFGVETGDPQIMKTIKKGIDYQKLRNAFSSANKVGLNVHGTFMIGLPGETRDSVQKTVQLAQELPMDSLQISIATPFPGTEFYKMCEENHWLVTTDWSHYDGRFGSVVSYPQLSKKEIEELQCAAIRETGTALFKRLSLVRKFKNEVLQFGTLAAIKHGVFYIAKKMCHELRKQ